MNWTELQYGFKLEKSSDTKLICTFQNYVIFQVTIINSVRQRRANFNFIVNMADRYKTFPLNQLKVLIEFLIYLILKLCGKMKSSSEYFVNIYLLNKRLLLQDILQLSQDSSSVKTSSNHQNPIQKCSSWSLL